MFGPRMILLDLARERIAAEMTRLPDKYADEAIVLADYIHGKGRPGADERRRRVIEAIDHIVSGFDEGGDNRHVKIEWD